MAKRPYILRSGVASRDDLIDGFDRYPGADYTGRDYYVNNITGSAAASGEDWDNAMDQVSTAVTASETYRQLQSGTTNDYVRNRIFVQGTGTAYTALTALPLYCDLIGVGTNFYGNGAGIPRIGADSGTGVGGAICTATVRGLYCNGIQFQGGGSSYPVSFANVFRTTFENCGFFVSGSPAGDMAAGFRVSGAAGGLVIKDCHWGNNSSESNFATIGLSFEGTYFHNSKVEDCYIAGDTGIKIASTCINTFGSIVKNNYIGYGGSGATAGIGVDDDDTAGHVIYAGNYIWATVALDIENNGSGRCIGNYAANDFVAAS